MARGQLKYRCLTVGVIPFSHDLHLEQSTKTCHSVPVQEIEADFNPNEKSEPPELLRLSCLKGALQLCP